MVYDLKNRNVLVSGGSKGLGAVICRKFAAEGCNVAINFNSDAAAADNLAQELYASNGVKVVTVKADCGNLADCARCVRETVKAFGGIDILIGNAGWTRFSAFDDLSAASEEDWDRCWAVNVKGQMALLREALPTFKSNEEGGVFIMTNSIAGISNAASSLPYAVSKAAALRMMKAFAATQGPKVRCNAVLPGLMLTEWGKQFPEDRVKEMEEAAVLKKVTDLDDCADVYIMLARNTSMTGIRIQVDGGLRVETA